MPVPTVVPRWLRPAILALTAFLLLACFSTPFKSNDAYWHLKTGQYIVQNHALPVPDPFSFTTYLGKPAYRGEETTRYFNLTHEWLAQILMYLAYAVGGFPLVVFLRAVCFSAVCGIVGLVAYHRTHGFYLSWGAALLAAAVIYGNTADRPAMITLLLLAVTVTILEYRRWLWFLPPLFLFWSNCHGGYFMGWLAIGAYGAEALWLRWKGWPLPDERRFFMAAAASLLLSGVNPNGFKVFATLYYYHNSVLQSRLGEWQHARLWPPHPFSVALAAGLAVLLLGRGKARPADWLLFGIFALAGIWAIRNMVFLAVIGPLVIATYLPWKSRPLPVAAQFAIAVVLLTAGAARVAQGKAFQLYAFDAVRPAGAAGFMLAHHITGRMFNTYEHGGYLMWRLWPQEQVFVDGRALNETVFQDYRDMAYNLASPGGKPALQLLDQYGIQVIVLTGFEYVVGTPHLLVTVLADPGQTEWKLVYQDGQAIVFMRQPPPGVQPLNSLSALAGLETQCAEHIRLVPDEPFCARGACQLFERLNDPARARRWMAYYLEHKIAPDPEAEREYTRLVMAGR